MLIRIQSDELGGQEWALIELQGKIESQEDIGLEGASLPVGTIQLSNTVGSLIICLFVWKPPVRLHAPLVPAATPRHCCRAVHGTCSCQVATVNACSVADFISAGSADDHQYDDALLYFLLFRRMHRMKQ